MPTRSDDGYTRWVICPACDGDGWGWRLEGPVVVQTEGGCIACKGSGLIESGLLECAMRIRRQAEKHGLL
jgi:DnaJ-class molecular chaperone